MITGIIQARTGSTRLPSKVLMDVGGLSALAHLVKQVRAANTIEQLVLATSDLPRDDALAEAAGDLGLKVYRGDEDRIMSRLYNAARTFNAGLIVRLLGDCPLADPELIDQFVNHMQKHDNIDLVTNQNPHSFPDGYDISVIRPDALQKLCAEFTANHKPEHLSGFWNNPHNYKTVNLSADKNYFAYCRLTLDYPADLEVIRHVILALDGKNRIIHMHEAVDYLQSHPSIAAMNKEYI